MVVQGGLGMAAAGDGYHQEDVVVFTLGLLTSATDLSLNGTGPANITLHLLGHLLPGSRREGKTSWPPPRKRSGMHLSTLSTSLPLHRNGCMQVTSNAIKSKGETQRALELDRDRRQPPLKTEPLCMPWCRQWLGGAVQRFLHGPRRCPFRTSTQAEPAFGDAAEEFQGESAGRKIINVITWQSRAV